ncbi:MAG: histidine kinase N-terminal 7TM domain-containing protein [Methanosarcinaceae archaeon]|nr:histidine kinase N-terminal 7TM domain-containing protein [Methanosarcinaceae archaeon]
MGALIFSTLLSILLAAKVLNTFDYRKVPFARHFVLLMLSMALWSAFYAGELGCTDLNSKYFFARLQYLGLALAPVAWFMFSVEYCGISLPYIRRIENFLFIVPGLTFLSVLTSDYHGFHYSGYFLDFSEAFPILVFDHGPSFWGFYVYSFILVFLGLLLFIRQFIHAGAPYRAQAGISLLGAIMPVVGNLLHMGDVGIFALLDPTPFLFTLSGILLFWSIVHYEFLNLVPVARENVIEIMQDGYVVLDSRGNIVDINPAALALTGKKRGGLLGKPLKDMFGEDYELCFGEGGEKLKDGTDGEFRVSDSYEGSWVSDSDVKCGISGAEEERNTAFPEEFSIKIGLKKGFYSLRTSSLASGACEDGQLIVIRDVTETHRHHEALKQANKKINLMSNITRHDILNQVNVLSGYMELLSEFLPPEVKADPKVEKYTKNLKKGVETIHSQILFTKDYQDLGVVSPVWQSVSHILREAAFAFSNSGIRFSIQEGDLEVYADPLLRKAFYNLFDNASSHGLKVSVISVRFRKIGGSMLIEVRDNGIGVPADMKEYIFEKSVGKNTGLGLFLVKGILSITGIQIKETGQEEEGACFEILVPSENWRRGSKEKHNSK